MFLDLHPLVIHFPIALLSSAVLFDFIAVIFKKDELLITSWWVMLLGLFSSAFSIITGLNLNLHRRGKRIDPLWVETKFSMTSLINRANELLG